jgi:hypothetical protein
MFSFALLPQFLKNLSKRRKCLGRIQSNSQRKENKTKKDAFLQIYLGTCLMVSKKSLLPPPYFVTIKNMKLLRILIVALSIFISKSFAYDKPNYIYIRNLSNRAIELKPLTKSSSYSIFPESGIVKTYDPKPKVDLSFLSVPENWQAFTLQIKSEKGFTAKFRVERPDDVDDGREHYVLFVRTDSKGIQASIAARNWDGTLEGERKLEQIK